MMGIPEENIELYHCRNMQRYSILVGDDPRLQISHSLAYTWAGINAGASLMLWTTLFKQSSTWLFKVKHHLHNEAHKEVLCTTRTTNQGQLKLC